MSLQAELQEKIIELESRVAFQEDALAQLSDQMAWQGQKLALQERTIEQLIERLKLLKHELEQQGGPAEPANQPPPHY